MKNQPEVWLEDAINSYPPELTACSSCAFCRAQGRSPSNVISLFPSDLLWEKDLPGLASPAFHLQHIVGVTGL